MTIKFESIHAYSPARSTWCELTFGVSSLFFTEGVLAAIETPDGRVLVRDNLELAHYQLRQLNQWRDAARQTRTDHFTFTVALNEALAAGLTKIQQETEAHV